MTDSLKLFLSRFATLSEEEIAAFTAIFSPVSIKKLDHLFVENDKVTTIFYINDGLMRGYYNNGNNEITTNFYFGPTIMTDLIAVREHKPTQMNVQALKDSNCMVAEFSDLDNLVDQYPNLEYLFFRFLEHLYLFGVMRQHSFIFDSPQERYIKLFGERPKVIAEIPQRYISSYLGIKPETLSRIKNRIFKNL
ncbi:Crp/Fnr family transcriptional regulator [Flavobacterium jejuense]|uniref:Crp/Fnr family transcriptional regulator n=1 Tax=Flavobacterium jejuense TaxID=1544455 RepID=A0ABX0IMU1_9FLAO|nr:Crp/Fnr family transcriptional regulator [Flavobacterium jejuense]NHN24094.1 Crp/Fnr family transcriptional regulator [Flavobacterium jejuense]